MTVGLVLTIIVLVLVLIIFAIIYHFIRKVTRGVQDFSRVAFGTPNIVQGLKQVDEQAQTTPKNVFGAERTYLPMITRDFPEFDISDAQSRAKNVLTSYLRAVDERDWNLLTEGSDDLKNSLYQRIQMLNDSRRIEHFENIIVHKVALHNYTKRSGECSIKFQMAVEHVHYFENVGQKVYDGQKRKVQSKYEVEMVYIQDRDIISRETTDGHSLICPRCGGAITNLGAKKCPYCDTPVIEYNIRVWKFNKISVLA